MAILRCYSTFQIASIRRRKTANTSECLRIYPRAGAIALSMRDELRDLSRRYEWPQTVGGVLCCVVDAVDAERMELMPAVLNMDAECTRQVKQAKHNALLSEAGRSKSTTNYDLLSQIRTDGLVQCLLGRSSSKTSESTAQANFTVQTGYNTAKADQNVSESHRSIGAWDVAELKNEIDAWCHSKRAGYRAFREHWTGTLHAETLITGEEFRLCVVDWNRGGQCSGLGCRFLAEGQVEGERGGQKQEEEEREKWMQNYVENDIRKTKQFEPSCKSLYLASCVQNQFFDFLLVHDSFFGLLSLAVPN